MKTNRININGEKLSYIDSEKGNSTLLFIHGAFINKEYWSNQLAHFSKKYRVVAIDLVGHGSSSYNRTDWGILNFGKDVGEFIKELSLKRVVLIGHSFGADVMLETVTYDSSQIIGLIEIDHMKNVGTEMPQENIDQLIESLKTDFAGTCEYYAQQALVTKATNPELVTKLVKDYREMNPTVGIPLLQNNFAYASRETELLKGLKLKLHLLHVNYLATNEDALKKYLGDNYELQIMDGTCHYPMLEHPNDFNKSLEKILLAIDDEGIKRDSA